jgi:hypothetical protein
MSNNSGKVALWKQFMALSNANKKTMANKLTKNNAKKLEPIFTKNNVTNEDLKNISVNTLKSLVSNAKNGVYGTTNNTKNSVNATPNEKNGKNGVNETTTAVTNGANATPNTPAANGATPAANGATPAVNGATPAVNGATYTCVKQENGTFAPINCNKVPKTVGGRRKRNTRHKHRKIKHVSVIGKVISCYNKYYHAIQPV